jgi:aminoglycoside/choline kinase family phosphotransferase
VVIDDIEARIRAYLEEQGLTAHVSSVLPLTGDASDRRYFRVLLDRSRSIVLALHGAAIEFKTMPFVAVARLLEEVPLPVPAILHHSDSLGIIGLEDLGDVTLQAHLGATSAADHAARYRQAVGFIARMQQRGAELASDAYPPYCIAFDVQKLTWELEFFVKHFLGAYRGATLDEPVRDALRQEWSAIVDELAAEPRVLCHRDYHSRNLMLRDGELFIIDFQDARMGPDTYDLASLLRDSYLDLAPQQVDELVAYFLALLSGTSGVTDDESSEFRRRFDLMALQRNLKALGTFGYQTSARGNPVYIQYIPRTINYVRANLDKYPRFGRLRELLSGPVEELR